MLGVHYPYAGLKRPGVSPTLLQWLGVASVVLALHIIILRELFIRLPTPSAKIMSRIEVELRAVESPVSKPWPLKQPPTKMAPPLRSVERRPITSQLARSPIVASPPQTMTSPTPQADTPLTAAPTPAPVENAPTAPATSSGVNEALTAPRNAAYLHNPKPIYPLAARRAGYEGKVIVRALIQTDGSAERVEVKKSSGYELLDRAALEAVKKWRFIPAKRGSEPTVEWVDIPWIFKLEEE